MSMSLTGAVSAFQPRPVRLALYGPAGVGKSTSLAAGAPAPFLVAVEDGAVAVDVPMLRPTNWEQLIELLTNLLNDAHNFQSVILDSITATERLAISYVMRKNGVTAIADVGYGKGYQQLTELFTQLFGILERIRDARGMHICLIGHSKISTFTDPSGKSWERYAPDLDPKRILPQFLQWPDALLFADFQKAVSTKKDGMKEIKVGFSTGERLLFTEHCAAYEAKNRYRLPSQMPLDIAAVFRHVGEFYGATTQK